MASTTLDGVLLKGVAASRPGAGTVAKGTIYSATDTGAITQSDGVSTWSTFATISSGLADPMTTRGDIIVRNASNVTARLAIGSTGKVLQSDGTDIAWTTPTAAVQAAHGARVVRASTSQSVGNNTFTAIAFDGTDILDTDSIHDPVTNNTRLTIPSISGVTTGLWQIDASGYTDASSGRVDCALRIAGTTNIVFVPQGFSGSVSGYQAHVQYVFTAGDYVECMVRTTGGTFSAAYDVGISPLFSIAFLGKVT